MSEVDFTDLSEEEVLSRVAAVQDVLDRLAQLHVVTRMTVLATLYPNGYQAIAAMYWTLGAMFKEKVPTPPT